MFSAPSSSTSPATAPFSTFPPSAIPPRRSSTSQAEKQSQQVASLALLQAQTPHATAASSSRRHRASSSASTHAAGTARAPMLHAVSEGSSAGDDSASAPMAARHVQKPSTPIPTLTAASATAGLVSLPSGGSRNVPEPAAAAGAELPVNALGTMSRASAPDPERFASADLDFARRATWSDAKERVIRGPFDYLYGVRGKEFRTKVIQAFNAWLDVPAESLATITRVVGMLHTASLLVDDVEDSSTLRRGLPVAHHIFGAPQTINSANYMCFVALCEVQKLRNHARALAIFTEELVHLHRGQGMDLFWRDSLTCPTEDDYLEMVSNKTGGLFRLSIRLMQAESRSPVDFVPLVNILGLLFQIQDDYRNLMATEYAQSKGLCEDLTEGKFSFPIIHSIRSDPADLQLLNILRLKTTDDDVKRYAVAHMESTGSFAYTREVLAVLTARARALADELDEGRGRSRVIHEILDKLAIQ